MNWIKFGSINLGLLLFFSLNPYPRWLLPQGMFQVVFLFTTTIFILQIQKKYGRGLVFNRNKLVVFICAFLYMLYYTTPLFHEFRIGHFFYFILFLQVIFLNNILFYRGYLVLRKIFVVVCISALIFWILNAVGFPLFYYNYVSPDRINPLEYYRIYGPSLSLYNGNSPTGGGIERICGVFAEPGHFGIYLGLILLVEKFRFKFMHNILFLVTGFLTFSTAFYGILALGILYRVADHKRIPVDILKLAGVLMIFIIIFSASSSQFRKTMYGRVLDNKKTEVTGAYDIIENRVPESFVNKFNEFIGTKDFVIGKGYYTEEMLITNWRGLIYRFGILGAVFMLILIFSILRNVDLKYAFLIVLISFLIISHRVYLMYSPAIYLVLLTATSITTNSKIHHQFKRISIDAK